MLETNKVYCADSLELMKEVEDKSISLVLTDPPYGLGKKLHDGGTWSTNKIYDAVLKWDKPISMDYFTEIFRVSINQVIWGGHLYNLPTTRCYLSWVKTNRMETMGDFELAWTSFDKCCKLFEESINPDGKRVHPTQKPVELMKWIVYNYSNENDLILDPFAGSGSTLVACKALNRRYIGIEKCEAYVSICNQRLRQEYLL